MRRSEEEVASLRIVKDVGDSCNAPRVCASWVCCGSVAESEDCNGYPLNRQVEP